MKEQCRHFCSLSIKPYHKESFNSDALRIFLPGVNASALVKNGVAQTVMFLDTEFLPASLARNILADVSLSDKLP